jgi:hypothetical protein
VGVMSTVKHYFRFDKGFKVLGQGSNVFWNKIFTVLKHVLKDCFSGFFILENKRTN